MFMNYTSYVPRYVYPILEQLVVPPTYTPHSIGNLFIIVVQPVTNKDRQYVQQKIITAIPTIEHVNTNLPTHVPRGFAHQPPNGSQLGDSHGGSSSGENLLGRPPFNPSVG
jgi:hypothetical protein